MVRFDFVLYNRLGAQDTVIKEFYKMETKRLVEKKRVHVENSRIANF